MSSLTLGRERTNVVVMIFIVIVGASTLGYIANHNFGDSADCEQSCGASGYHTFNWTLFLGVLLAWIAAGTISRRSWRE